jgi:hypothetical protein
VDPPQADSTDEQPIPQTLPGIADYSIPQVPLPGLETLDPIKRAKTPAQPVPPMQEIEMPLPPPPIQPPQIHMPDLTPPVITPPNLTPPGADETTVHSQEN